MLNGLFTSSNYFLNPYAIPNIIVAVYSFSLGIFVLRKKKIDGLSLFLLTFTVGIYLSVTALMHMSNNPHTAHLWDKILYLLGVPFISINTYFFCLKVTGTIEKKKEKIILYSGYLIMAMFALSSGFTDLFVKFPPPNFFWGYYPNPAILYHFFLPLWIGFALRSAHILYRALKKEENVLERNRIKIFLISCLFGYIAACDFLPVYGIGIYPFGYIFITTLLTLLVYNFVKYKALGVDTVVHKTLLWLTSILLVVLPGSIVTLLISKILINILPLVLNLLILSVTLVSFAYYYFYLRPKIDNFFGRKQYAYYELLGRISETVSTTLDIEEFSHKLLNELDNCILPQRIVLWLVDEKKQYLFLFAEKTPPEKSCVFRETKKVIPGDDLIIKHLNETREVLETAIISIAPQYRHLKNSAFLTVLKSELIEVLVPLVMEGKLIGVLGLGRKRSLRLYAKADIEILTTLGEELGTAIYNALHHQDILEKQRLQQEIFLAKNIQENLLPRKAPTVSGLALCGLYIPAKEIGGDYYDFMFAPDGNQKVYITIGDVSGKGLDAGLVVSSVKSSLLTLVGFISSPKDILVRLNSILFEEIKEQKFVSLLLFMYEINQNVLKYSSCGHEHIIIWRQGKVEVVKSGGLILGMLDNIDSLLQEDTFDLNKGDKILLYTDGATEARNPEEELYGLHRLVESFRKHVHLPIKEVLHNIHQDIKDFISTRDQYDDITLVGIEKE